MKVAAARVPVYSENGKKLIGQLECGEGALVVSECGEGAVIAYMLGLVKKQDCANLVEEGEWKNTADEVNRFLAYAAAQKALLLKGHDPKGIDGAFGPKTEKAVTSFQTAAGVKADGIITKDVWDRLIG